MRSGGSLSRMFAKSLLGGSLLAGLVSMSGAAETAVDVAAAFCKTRTAGDPEAVKPLLTPSLLAVIAEAEARNRIIAEGNPDEKPPLGDGVPYQTFQDLPDTCEPGQPAERAGRTEVPVTYGFEKTPDANWTDTLVLVAADGRPMIDDVRYQGSADGGGMHGLREILHAMFDH